MSAEVEFTDNSEEVLRLLRGATEAAAEIIGGLCETYAKGLVAHPRRLAPEIRNSITHRVEMEENGPVLYVGSNLEVAAYVELGTGREYDPPPEWLENNARGGKGQAGLESWIYYDELEQTFKVGTPQPPRPFLRPAVLEHVDEYRKVIEDQMKNAESRGPVPVTLFSTSKKYEVWMVNYTIEHIRMFSQHIFRNHGFLTFFDNKSCGNHIIDKCRNFSVIYFIIIYNPLYSALTFYAIVMQISIKSYTVFCSGISVIYAIPCRRNRMRHRKDKITSFIKKTINFFH